MESRQARSQEDTNFRILRTLESNPDITQRELATRVGLSLGGLNYCLKALIAKGCLKVQNFSSSKHKLRYAYLLTPQGIAEKSALTGRFIGRKLEEYETLRAEIEALRAEAAISQAQDQDTRGH